jgi:hypothetical protein
MNKQRNSPFPQRVDKKPNITSFPRRRESKPKMRRHGRLIVKIGFRIKSGMTAFVGAFSNSSEVAEC